MNRKDVGVQISNIYCFLHAPRRFRQHLSFLHSVLFCIKGRDSKRSNGSQPLIVQCGIPEDERRNLLRIRCKYNPSSLGWNPSSFRWNFHSPPASSSSSSTTAPRISRFGSGSGLPVFSSSSGVRLAAIFPHFFSAPAPR